MLAGKPLPRTIPNAPALIRENLISSGRRLAVIDDDPTGVQTVHGTKVFMSWSVDVLRKAISSGEPVFYVSTNSRALNPEEAKGLSFEVGQNLRGASRKEGREVLLASRSDSTLRGHFPYEVDALISGLGAKIDGIIIAPAFFECDRYTIDDVHWVEQGGEMVPAAQTEFARDPIFGFKNSNLREWVAEKTKGAVKAEDVRSLPLELVREGGPEAVTAELLKTSNKVPVIANAACYEDLEVLALGIQEAERRGKKFAYRCAASFVKARGGFEKKPLLTHGDLATSSGPGLVVAGSYVERTSQQLAQLLTSGMVEGVELRVQELFRRESRDIEIQSVVDRMNQKLGAGTSLLLYTSREMHRIPGMDFQDAGNVIMGALCEVLKRIKIRPGYLVAKGGITSIELARTALNVKEALVLGQIIAGVPVLRFSADARWPDIPYVVFPGNVGDSRALLRVVSILKGVQG